MRRASASTRAAHTRDRRGGNEVMYRQWKNSGTKPPSASVSHKSHVAIPVSASQAAVKGAGMKRTMMNLRNADCCRVDVILERVLERNYRLAIRHAVGINLVTLYDRLG